MRAESALKYLIFLADVNQLFDVGTLVVPMFIISFAISCALASPALGPAVSYPILLPVFSCELNRSCYPSSLTSSLALGMYDFDLTMLVAQQSQKDPKEYYLPLPLAYISLYPPPVFAFRPFCVP